MPNEEIKITYHPAKYDGPLPISKTVWVAKVEWVDKKVKNEKEIT
jgi:hypothetical protein